jgi:hypothetical protein
LEDPLFCVYAIPQFQRVNFCQKSVACTHANMAFTMYLLITRTVCFSIL